MFNSVISHQVSILLTFNAKPLRAQIPKALKKTDGLTVFFALLESAGAIALRKMLMKLIPDA